MRTRSMMVGVLGGLLFSLAAFSGTALQAEELPAIAGQPSYSPAEWVLVANHLHSAPARAGWRKGVKHILEFCDKRNIDFAFLTDHDSIETWFWDEFKVTGNTVPVGGQEWTSPQGHANLISFRGEKPDDVIIPCGEEDDAPCADGNQDHAGVIKETQDRGGLVIINHPILKGYRWPTATLNADAVEINPTLYDPSGKKGRAWWHAQLLSGVRITGFGGSDYHYLRPWSEEPEIGQGGGCCHRVDETVDAPVWSPNIDSYLNLVRVREKTIDAVMDAIRAGHVAVVRDQKQPRVFIGCDANGDGDYDDYMMGDRVRAHPRNALDFQIRVVGGKGRQVNLIDAQVGMKPGQETIETLSIDSDDFVYRFQRETSDEKKHFVRAELGNKGAAVTNPIYY